MAETNPGQQPQHPPTPSLELDVPNTARQVRKASVALAKTLAMLAAAAAIAFVIYRLSASHS